jgi:hypothetical protein
MRSVSRCQQIGLLCLSLALCVFVVGCGSKVTPDNFMKIKTGQTKAEVEGILGSPTETKDVDFGGEKVKESTWKSGNSSIQIRYDKNDKVAAPKGEFK